jgi:hypothetical protein
MNTHANRSKDDEVGLALASHFVALQRRRKKPGQGERGTTLVEVAVAGAILALGLTSLCVLLGTTVNEVKRGHTASGAEQNTVARLDQVRTLTWDSITNPGANPGATPKIVVALNTPISSDSSSTISREVITVSPAAVPQSSPLPVATPSPTPTPGPGFSVIKTGGSVTITPSPYPNLSSEKLVNVTVRTEWISYLVAHADGTASTIHTRELSTLVSSAGSAAPQPVTPTPTP